MANKITDLQAKASKSKAKWESESLGRGSGALVIYKGYWYFRYQTVDGKRQTIPIGPYSTNGKKVDIGVQAARDKAHELSREMRTLPDRDLKAQRVRLEKAAKEAKEKARYEAARLSKYTLLSLLNLYREHLEHLGKDASAKEVKSLFRINIEEAFPEKAALPARDVTSDDIAEILRAIARDKGHGRTAAKVRSYMMAAYTLATKARHLPDAPAEMIAFQLTSNPVAAIPAMPQYNRARQHALGLADLQAVYSRLQLETAIAARVLSLVILSGGQRVRQLLRLDLSHVDMNKKQIALLDAKGRRSVPRPHIVPLGDEGFRLVANLAQRAKDLKSPWLFTVNGKGAVQSETVSKFASDLSKFLQDDEKINAPFMASDLRRTVETLLAEHGVSKDIRAQLLSHELGGIQAKHYDRHQYINEKRNAVTLLESLLLNNPPTGAKVRAIRSRKS